MTHDKYINIIELLDSVKDICRKQSYCRDCPLSLSYTHANDDRKYYYCSLEGTPERWQIDSVNDGAVYYKVERGWLRNG